MELDHELDLLIGALCEGILSPQGFAPALSLIERMVEGRDARLALTDKRADKVLCVFGTDSEATQTAHVKSPPSDSRHSTASDSGRTLVERLADPQGFEVVLSIHRLPRQAAFGENESRLVRRLILHLLHATRAHFEVSRLRLRMAIGISALDELDMGVIVADASGQVWFANRQAEAIFAAKDGLTCKDGFVRQTAPSRARGGSLASFLAAAANEGRSGDVLIKRSSTGKIYLGRAFPLHHTQESAEPWQTPLALLLVSDPETSYALPCQTLKDCFGLTDKEAELAQAIGEGRTPEEYASASGVTISTVRTQLRAIFAKTNTNRQVDLIRLLGRIPKGPCKS